MIAVTSVSEIGAQLRRKTLSRRVVSGLLALGEALIVMGAGLAIYAIYVPSDAAGSFPQYLIAIAVYAVFLWQIFTFSGLYRLNRFVKPRLNWPKIAVLCWLAASILVFCSFALKISADFSRVWASSWLISVIILLPLFRVGMTRYIRRSAVAGMLTKNIVIYGSGENGSRLIERIEELGEPWNRIVGVFDDRVGRVPRICGSFQVAGNSDALIKHAQRNGSDEVLLAMPLASPQRYIELVNKLRPLPVNIRVVPDLAILDIPNLPTSSGGSFGIPMISILRKPVSGWGAFGKRAIDIGLTGMAVLIGLPLIAVISALIKLDSRGPVFFKQKRYGFQNEIINVLKFRTMYVDREDADAEKLTSRNDPRVTRVGKWLRRFSLDELPQLFNVMRGEMSLVGPRPHAMSAKAGGILYEDVIATYGLRIKVKPGLTGWAQVNGARGNTETEEDLKKRVAHDLYYIEYWSVALDLRIILMTFWIVFKGENSY